MFLDIWTPVGVLCFNWWDSAKEFELGVKSFRLSLRLTWEPFSAKFQPVQDSFLAHTLIVVRSAGVEYLVNQFQRGQKADSAMKSKSAFFPRSHPLPRLNVLYC